MSQQSSNLIAFKCSGWQLNNFSSVLGWLEISIQIDRRGLQITLFLRSQLDYFSSSLTKGHNLTTKCNEFFQEIFEFEKISQVDTSGWELSYVSEIQRPRASESDCQWIPKQLDVSLEAPKTAANRGDMIWSRSCAGAKNWVGVGSRNDSEILTQIWVTNPFVYRTGWFFC